jgi:hypothetical protein
VLDAFASKAGNHTWIGSVQGGSDLVSDQQAIFPGDS